MRVAAVQYRSSSRVDLERSRAELAGLARRAASGSELVVLPEMAATGYLFPDAAAVRAVAEEADGPTLAALAPVARAHRAWVVCGFPERAADRLFNSALVIDPAGALRGVYRKTLLYEADLGWATPGDSGYLSFETDGGRVSVGICMDLNDDRFVDFLRADAPDAVAFPTNWVESPDLGVDPWTYWAWRMTGLRSALVAANTWGVDGAVRFTGESCVLRQRTILAHLPVEGNGLLRASW